MSDLLSVVVKVQAQADVTLPAHTGRMIYNVWMRWLEAYDAALAKHWHDSQGLKPYTCSTLIHPNSRTLACGDVAWFRITTLEKGLTRLLRSYLDQPPNVVIIGETPFEILSITDDSQRHTWANSIAYEDLAAPHLLMGANPERRLKMEFAAPVVFNHHEMNMPFPLPELVFGSLLDKWNAFSPISIHQDIRKFCASGLSIGYFNLRSQRVQVLEQNQPIGGKGDIQYVVTRYDRYWMSIVGLLANYAFYAGVGRFTALGLGQTRHVPMLNPQMSSPPQK
ncbi:MAG: CRISPR system precrRNA processing endoribonuclease RAMP protein Cas6 [Anaerolineae bacterium]|jgi:CRISPR-associated endoribonuclease Cas6|nr:CRISPR system precrRNA processing endoribonuclease RAMP protein Cas6 [Anaerolineae bacterium]